MSLQYRQARGWRDHYEDGVLHVAIIPPPMKWPAPDFVEPPPPARETRARRFERRVLLWLRDLIDRRLFK